MCFSKLILTSSILIVFVVAALATNVKPPITKTVAIQKALLFCASVNWNSGQTDHFKVVRGSTNSYNNNSFIYVNDGVYCFTIDANTGIIRAASIIKAFARRSRDINNLNEQQAITKSGDILQAIGINVKDNLKLELCKYSGYSNRPGQKLWSVLYRMYYKGYKYDPLKYGILVNLDPVDGSLVGFGKTREVSIPTSDNIKVAEAKAKNVAIKYFSAHNVVIQTNGHAELQIVNPNNLWEDTWKKTGIYTEESGTRLAWIINFQREGLRQDDMTRLNWQKTVIWVDAENGKIIGGTKS